MAKIPADKDVKKLIGSVLIDADEKRVNPNGIELRLGKHVLFHSTGEEKELGPDMFLKVHPGETVSISSMESIDFSAEKVQEILQDCMLMGLITPTTTMMREGISQVTTKIDTGFHGNLNWGLRNGSTKELILQYGEPIFKLTIFVLDKDESPKLAYGERPDDKYQDAKGITRSKRRISADIPRAKMISSSFDKLDPKKQLQEAGYPFDHIGTELRSLHGKFEIVSKDVGKIEDEFRRRTSEMTSKIESETNRLSSKIEDMRRAVLDKVESMFDKKFLKIVGIIIGAIPIMYGGVVFLQGTSLSGSAIAFLAVVAGIVIILVTLIMSRRSVSEG